MKDVLGPEELLIELTATESLVRNKILTKDYTTESISGMGRVYPEIFGCKALSVASPCFCIDLERSGDFAFMRPEVINIQDAGRRLKKVGETTEHLGPT